MPNDTRCSIESCQRSGKITRGWCEMHYVRWRRHSDPLVVLRRERSLGAVDERFYANVSEPNKQGCLLWKGTISPQGYGRFTVDGVQKSAHCVAYEMIVGPIPENYQLDHLCHSNDVQCVGGNGCKHRRCVNTAHLEPVTSRENTIRGNGPTAINASKTHCIRNHPFNEKNTYFYKGWRRCRPCKKFYR